MSRLQTILTVDYEIHGNGDGCPRDLMVEPTERLLRVLDEYGAKLTIMADVAEILKFKEYKETTGRDDYHYEAIADQLRRAVASGHDVQLHIHSSYFNATHRDQSWAQDWAEYDFANLPYERMDWMVGTCKAFLESLLRPASPGYACVAFRAANWSVSPSRSVVRALVNHGIEIDTSVFKYGKRDGAVHFDYSHAHSPLVPWRASEADICRRDANGKLWELPIYSEQRRIAAFLTVGRLYRVFAGLGHKVRRSPRDDAPTPDGKPEHASPRTSPLRRVLQKALQKHAWKADFNQCDGRQLVRASQRALTRCEAERKASVPFVLIGHSKLFTRQNERSLRSFLSHVSRHPDRFGFETLSGARRSQGQWS